MGSAHPTQLLSAVCQHFPEAFNTLTTDLTLFERIDNGATGFVVVGAIGKLAFSAVRLEINEAMQNFLFIQVDRGEVPDAG